MHCKRTSFMVVLAFALGVAASVFGADVLVSGEWHAEKKTTRGATEESTKQQFIEIGNALHKSDPHGRMIGIHPMTSHGSVREFVGSEWMSFGDYQQNYQDLHQRILDLRGAKLPVVNSEYGYFLRDRDGDGRVDKPNSFDLESIRHSSWDIAMAGGYQVAGFGTTYFGGNRDPGPFNLQAEKNDPWEEDVHHLRTFFTSFDWWKLEPHDGLIRAPFARDGDGSKRSEGSGRRISVIVPPKRTYWLLADPGKTYVAYVRGDEGVYEIEVGAAGLGKWDARLFGPRSGEWRDIQVRAGRTDLHFRAPDGQDWVVVAEKR